MKKRSIELLEAATKRYNLPKAEIIHEYTVLHEGWEMDNHEIIIKTVDGRIMGLRTSHGGPYFTDLDKLSDKLKETRGSLQGLETAFKILFEAQEKDSQTGEKNKTKTT